MITLFFYQQLTQSHGLGKQIKEHRSPPLRLDQGDCISNCWVWHNSLEHQLTSDLYREIPRQAYRGVWPYVLIASNNRTNCWKTGKTTIRILARRFAVRFHKGCADPKPNVILSIQMQLGRKSRNLPTYAREVKPHYVFCRPSVIAKICWKYQTKGRVLF